MRKRFRKLLPFFFSNHDSSLEKVSISITDNLNISAMERKTIINYDVLWGRISVYARKAGRVTTRPVLTLYYVMVSKNTPQKDKMLILSTLSYLVLPIDILDAKRVPILGWFDEILSLSVTYQKVRNNVTPEITTKVNLILDRWYPRYTEYLESSE